MWDKLRLYKKLLSALMVGLAVVYLPGKAKKTPTMVPSS